MVVNLLDRPETDRLFHALADATRRDILRRVMEEEHSVSELARSYPMSFAAVQKHVTVLTDARLVTKTRSGRQQLVRGDVETIRLAGRLLDELEAVWRARMARFDAVLAEQDAGQDGPDDTAAPQEPTHQGADR